jgi:hypothetical protein
MANNPIELDPEWANRDDALADDVESVLRELSIEGVSRLARGPQRPGYRYTCEGALLEFYRDISGEYLDLGKIDSEESMVASDMAPYVFGLAPMEELAALNGAQRKDSREPSKFFRVVAFVETNWGLRNVAKAASLANVEDIVARRRAYWRHTHKVC